jgi:gas vesicle protein
MSDYKKYGEYSNACRNSETVKTAITFLAIGAGIGALVSLLFSPHSGAEIRQAFRGKLNDVRRGLSDQTLRLRRRTTALARETREKVMPISRMQ